MDPFSFPCFIFKETLRNIVQINRMRTSGVLLYLYAESSGPQDHPPVQ